MKQEKDISVEFLVPVQATKNPDSFRDWFLTNYSEIFKNMSDVFSIEKRQKKQTEENIFKTVIRNVSIVLYGNDISQRLFEKTRVREVNEMKKISCYILVKKLGYSNVKVGALLKIDRTTVLHHSNSVMNYIEVDRVFKNKIIEVEGVLEKLGIFSTKQFASS